MHAPFRNLLQAHCTSHASRLPPNRGTERPPRAIRRPTTGGGKPPMHQQGAAVTVTALESALRCAMRGARGDNLSTNNTVQTPNEVYTLSGAGDPSAFFLPARDGLHNPRESVVVRIGMGRKAPFLANSRAIGKKSNAADRARPRYHRSQGVIESASLNLKYPFGLSLSKPCAALRQAQRERFKQTRAVSICRPSPDPERS